MLPAGRVDWLARRWTDGLDCFDPLVSPVYGDYTGIPPLMIVTGSTEVLRDEVRRVAVRARENGVQVTYEEWNRMPHIFPSSPTSSPKAACCSSTSPASSTPSRPTAPPPAPRPPEGHFGDRRRDMRPPRRPHAERFTASRT
ncbi:hypothetical protein GCM10027612_54430 [Microbispora bryophytorum subsp. camponoti]